MTQEVILGLPPACSYQQFNWHWEFAILHGFLCHFSLAAVLVLWTGPWQATFQDFSGRSNYWCLCLVSATQPCFSELHSFFVVVFYCIVKVVESSLYLRRIQHCPTLPLSTTNKLLRYDSMDSKLYRSIQTLCGNRRHWYLFWSFPFAFLHHGMFFPSRIGIACSRTSFETDSHVCFSIKKTYFTQPDN